MTRRRLLNVAQPIAFIGLWKKCTTLTGPGRCCWHKSNLALDIWHSHAQLLYLGIE